MWKVLLALGLIASASATWKPIVGPSSSSFNKKIPFGDSHTYYGNEFLSEYANLGAEHLLLPSQHATVLEAEPLHSSFGSDVMTGISEPNWWISTEISLSLYLPLQDKCRPQKYALEYEGTLQIDQSLPSLDQFTLCNWMRFTNHSGDHTVLTYSRKCSHSIERGPEI